MYNIANQKKISQLEFKSYIALIIMNAEKTNSAENVLSPPYDPPSRNTIINNVGHVIIEQENKIRRRCNCAKTTLYTCV